MRGLLLALVTVILSMPALAKSPVYVAIIIDDMGNNLSLGRRAIDMPEALTYSVLPYTPFARRLAIRAHDAGKEVMLHEPMANISQLPLGPGALTMSLSKAQFVRTFEGALASVPYARGVNNHEGSYLTQQTRQMNWLMALVKRHGLYFIDSRTTPKTVALKVAEQHDVSAARRNIFLDDVVTFDAIDRQFHKLIRMARRQGTAIAIGHPKRVTLEYLNNALPQLQSMGINLVPVSKLISLQEATRLQYAKGETAR